MPVLQWKYSNLIWFHLAFGKGYSDEKTHPFFPLFLLTSTNFPDNLFDFLMSCFYERSAIKYRKSHCGTSIRKTFQFHKLISAEIWFGCLCQYLVIWFALKALNQIVRWRCEFFSGFWGDGKSFSFFWGGFGWTVVKGKIYWIWFFMGDVLEGIFYWWIFLGCFLDGNFWGFFKTSKLKGHCVRERNQVSLFELSELFKYREIIRAFKLTRTLPINPPIITIIKISPNLHQKSLYDSSHDPTHHVRLRAQNLQK